VKTRFSRLHSVAAAAVAALIGLPCGPAASATAADVVGGQTSVLLDTATLAAAANLTLSGVSSEVGAGNLGEGSVAFAITPRDAATLPTTFTYDPATFPALGSFSGTIEHAGSVFFNDNAVEVGDFTIGFDVARAGQLGGAASGFFVASTTGISAILFDIETPSLAEVAPDSLRVGADLLVSPEFASFLQGAGLASSDLSGADVGDALVEATAIPEPAAALCALTAVACASALRRRR
jgi:hypothetical protein